MWILCTWCSRSKYFSWNKGWETDYLPVHHIARAASIPLKLRLNWPRKAWVRWWLVGVPVCCDTDIEPYLPEIDHYEDVVEAIFQYLWLLRSAGYQRETGFHEMASLSALGFRFKEKGQAADYASSLAGKLQRGYPPEWTLSGPHVVRKEDPSGSWRETGPACCWDGDGFVWHWFPRTLKTRTGLSEQYYDTRYSIEPVSERMKKVSRVGLPVNVRRCKDKHTLNCSFYRHGSCQRPTQNCDCRHETNLFQSALTSTSWKEL